MESRMEAPVFSARRTVEEASTESQPPPPSVMTAPAFSFKSAESQPSDIRESDSGETFDLPSAAPEYTVTTSDAVESTGPAPPPPPPPQPTAAPPPPPPQTVVSPVPAQMPLKQMESGNSSVSLESAFGDVTEPAVTTNEASEYNAKNHVGSVSMWKKGFRQGIRGSSSAGAAPQGGMALPGMHADVLEDVFSTSVTVRPTSKLQSGAASAPAGFDAFPTTTASPPPPPPPPTAAPAPPPLPLDFASEIPQSPAFNPTPPSPASKPAPPLQTPAVLPTPPRQSKTYISPSFPSPAVKPATSFPSQSASPFPSTPATPIVSQSAAFSPQSSAFSQQSTTSVSKPAPPSSTPTSSEKKATVKDKKEFHGLVDFDNMMISGKPKEPAHPSTTEPAKSLNELAKLKAKADALARAQASPTTAPPAAAFAPPQQQLYASQPGMMMMHAQPYAQPYPMQQPGMMMVVAPGQQGYPTNQPGMMPYGAAAPSLPQQQYVAYPPPPHGQQYPPM